MRNPFQRLVSNRRGATAIEYGLIAALVAIAAMSGIGLFADRTITMWDYVSSTITGSAGG